MSDVPSTADETTLVTVDLGPRSYEIEIASGRLDRWAQSLQNWTTRRGHKPNAGRALVVTDRNTACPHADRAAESLHRIGWETASIELMEARDEARRLVLPDGIGEEIRVLLQAKGVPLQWRAVFRTDG